MYHVKWNEHQSLLASCPPHPPPPPPLVACTILTLLLPMQVLGRWHGNELVVRREQTHLGGQLSRRFSLLPERLEAAGRDL